MSGRRDPRRQARRPAFAFDANGPEEIARAAENLYGLQRFTDAMGQWERAIDLLHTLYMFENMLRRKPSPADSWIVDGYTSALGATLAVDCSADVTRSVRATTDRLLAISTASRRKGLPASVYRNALVAMLGYAGHVVVDDIAWE